MLKVTHPWDKKYKCLHLHTENIHQCPSDKRIKPHINSACLAVKRKTNTVWKQCIFKHAPSAYEYTCIYNFRNYQHDLMVLSWVVKDSVHQIPLTQYYTCFIMQISWVKIWGSHSSNNEDCGFISSILLTVISHTN